MPKKISINELRERIVSSINRLEQAGIHEVDSTELPIIIFSSVKGNKRYGIDVGTIGYTKGGFHAVKIYNDPSLLILLYDESIKPKRGKRKS